MKRILVVTTLFFLALTLAVKLREQRQCKELKEDISNKTEDQERYSEKEDEHSKEKKENGPEEFLKFHWGIRTRSDQQKPGYPVNYQWQELQKAQLATSSKKSNSAARAQSIDNGVLGY